MTATSRISLILLITILTMDSCYTASIRAYDPRLGDEVILAPKKRPFCNAFTGCGRKRSLSPGMPVQELIRRRPYAEEESLTPFMDSENGVEELSRQIVAEAKLWEAIQEAGAEVARRKQREGFQN